jgi:MFS family permease
VGTALAALWMNFWWLSICLFLAGVGIAPALAVLFAVVSSTVKFSDTAEAYGWIGTGQLIGAALGSAAAGFLIDAIGPAGAFYVAAAVLVFGVLIPAIFRKHHPDLRGREAGPIPDTEPVPVIT